MSKKSERKFFLDFKCKARIFDIYNWCLCFRIFCMVLYGWLVFFPSGFSIWWRIWTICCFTMYSIIGARSWGKICVILSRRKVCGKSRWLNGNITNIWLICLSSYINCGTCPKLRSGNVACLKTRNYPVRPSVSVFHLRCQNRPRIY